MVKVQEIISIQSNFSKIYFYGIISKNIGFEDLNYRICLEHG